MNRKILVWRLYNKLNNFLLFFFINLFQNNILLLIYFKIILYYINILSKDYYEQIINNNGIVFIFMFQKLSILHYHFLNYFFTSFLFSISPNFW
jgi:hypothetical protein